MVRETPALDTLTATVRAEFLGRIVDMDADFVASRLTVRQTLSMKTAAAAESTIYLQLDSMARHVIPGLYRAGRARGLTLKGQLARVLREAAAARLSDEVAANLFALVRDADDYLTRVVAELLETLADADVSAVLLELWHTGDREFDPDMPGSENDYNSEDGTPNDCQTPRNHLMDLVSDAVIARLMKRCGGEILLAWSDALSLARS